MNAIYPSPERSWQGPAPRVVKGMRLVDAGVTVKDRILLHLLDYWGQMQRAEWPVELTQDGIAGVVGISRSHVAVTLPDLIDEDMVEVTTQRVKGRPRRVKVYALSYKGGSYAGRRAQELLRTEVTAMDDTGEWLIPLDGLIQVHKVHMLTALRLVDEENTVDLRKADELSKPAEAVEEVGGEAVEEVGEEVEEEPPEEAVGLAGTGVAEAPSPGTAVAPDAAAPSVAVPARAATVVGARTSVQPSPLHAQGGTDDYWPRQEHYHYRQPVYWSPLRFGTGRTPSAAYVATMLMMGFMCLMFAVAFFGLSPGYCAAAWVPLVLVGVIFSLSGFKSTWALGPRREVWTAAALGAHMMIGVTMVAFAAFGQEVIIDLMWASLVLGVPSLVLAAGTGRSVERRGSFMLLIGPVMVIAAITMAVMDPGEMGRTAAMPLLIITVGVLWAYLGWMMVRSVEDVETTPKVVAGGSIGLAIAALAGAGNLASEGDLSLVLGAAVALWLATSVYVAAIMLVPPLVHLRPDTRTLYISLAVAGAAALVTASVFFVWGGLISVGIMEAVIAVGMLALVAPEMKEMGTGGRPLVVLGVLVAAVTVLAVGVGL